MNGGTLATNITQTYSLINTTGVIEKDKNIYYAPRFSQTDLGKKIYTAFLEKFLSVTSSARPSEYQDVSLSQWSPEDRTLKVKGMPDDFRCNSSYGYALNYLLIKRTITKGEEEPQDLYYGFFIDSARQVGVGTVSLDVTPDVLTNAFYLLNMDTIGSADYEPFNNKLSNCFVERQHYDRFQSPVLTFYTISNNLSSRKPNSICGINTSDILDDPVSIGDPTIIAIDGELVLGEYHATGYYLKYGKKLELRKETRPYPPYAEYVRPYLDGVAMEEVREHTYVKLGNRNSYRNMTSSEILYDMTEYTEELTGYKTFANEDIFINTEENFSFKEQHRDYKSPISPYINNLVLSQSELKQIEEANSISDLSSALQQKVLILSMKAVRVTVTDPEKVLGCDMIYGTDIEHSLGYSTLDKTKNFVGSSGIRKSYKQVDVPVYMPPKELEKFRDEAGRYGYHISYNDMAYSGDCTIYTRTISPTPNTVAEARALLTIKTDGAITNNIFPNNKVMTNDVSNLLISGFAEYVLSAQIINNPPFLNYIHFETRNGKQHLIIDCNLNDVSEGCVLTPIATDEEEDTSVVHAKGRVVWAMNRDVTSDNIFYVGGYSSSLLGFSYRGEDGNDFERKHFLINRFKETSANLKTKYVDPVLEQEPYSLYSLSRLGLIESPLLKKRYYRMTNDEKYDVPLYFIQSFNDTYKTSIVPEYTFDGVKVPYYNEALTVTLTSSLPIATDSYAQYIQNNKAQMKNQFAVLDYNSGVGLLQTSLVTGVGQVAKGAIAMGGWGALAGGVSATSDTINALIDWDKNTKVTEMNQQAKKSDMGSLPDTYKQAGSDIYFDIITGEYQEYLYHYSIDTISYNSICKFLERVGYRVNIYDSLNVMNRKGWNYIKLVTFDFNAYLNANQEATIKNIMTQGVTLVHEPVMLEQGQHNYETNLDE